MYQKSNMLIECFQFFMFCLPNDAQLQKLFLRLSNKYKWGHQIPSVYFASKNFDTFNVNPKASNSKWREFYLFNNHAKQVLLVFLKINLTLFWTKQSCQKMECELQLFINWWTNYTTIRETTIPPRRNNLILID